MGRSWHMGPEYRSQAYLQRLQGARMLLFLISALVGIGHAWLFVAADLSVLIAFPFGIVVALLHPIVGAFVAPLPCILQWPSSIDSSRIQTDNYPMRRWRHWFRW